MKSFGIKRDEKDPRWFGLFMPWLRDKTGIHSIGDSLEYYGVMNNDGNRIPQSSGSNFKDSFDRIITIDEWEDEFLQPKLAGREYDLELIRAYKKWQDGTIQQFIENRYAKQERISEIKEQIEKLNNELKELEK